MATVGMVAFLLAGGLLVSAANMTVALLLTAIRPRVRVTWRAGVAGWLVNAIGLTVSGMVVDTWLLSNWSPGDNAASVATAWVASVAIALATAAIVSFVVLRLRRAQGWVFFLILTLLAIPLRLAVTRG